MLRETTEPKPSFPRDAKPYSVKRDGVNLIDCDSEPVQTPGCVQAHGALLVLRIADLTVLQASENLGAVLGHAAAAVLGRPVGCILEAGGEARLRHLLDTEPTEHNPIYAFTLPAAGTRPALDVALHTIDGAAVVEFEATSRSAGSPTGGTGMQAEPDHYTLIKKTVSRLQTIGTLSQFCQVLADEVRQLSGMDRVMVYKFHADDHGEVFAESRKDTLPPWLGLHYPAEDIPKPARAIFSRTWIRPVPDINGELAEMVPLCNPDSGMPLDMTFCALRGVSVMYTEYLQNMGVSAGLTMPLRRGETLWGLIACHHYSGPLHLPYQLRAACEFLAQVGSLQHQAAEDKENAEYRGRLDEANQQLVANAALKNGLLSLIDGSPSLLGAMQATGAALFHREQWRRIGQTPDDGQLGALADWLTKRMASPTVVTPLYATESLAADYPAGETFAQIASGVLAAPLSRSGDNLMLWFRPEVSQTVNWGGNPHDKPVVPGPNGPRLTPRRSFELFTESVRMRALPWKQVEIDAAGRLRTMIMEIVITRAEGLASLNADLARSNEELDAFAYIASHDLKEPLRGIHKYAHQLMENAAADDDEDRRKLKSLMRLTLRMDSLLDSLLHFSRVGREDLVFERVDLNELLGEAVEMIGSRLADGQSEVVAPGDVPPVLCDRIRVREVLVNLLSNALKYNDKPLKRVEFGYIAADDAAPRTRFPAYAAGQSVYYVRDNGIGIAARHFEPVFKLFKRLHARDEFGGGSGAGLTIVRKLVGRHGGHVWPESVPGEGCTFYFTLGAASGVGHA